MKSLRPAFSALSCLLLLAFSIPTPSFAGQYDQVYSIVSVEFVKSTDFKLRPVILNRIDGDSSIRTQEAVPPGKHLVVADLPPSKAHHERIATQNSLEIDMQPCTRYYIAARLTDEVTRHWSLVIRDQDNIGECAAKYLKPADPKAAAAKPVESGKK